MEVRWLMGRLMEEAASVTAVARNFHLHGAASPPPACSSSVASFIFYDSLINS